MAKRRQMFPDDFVGPEAGKLAESIAKSYILDMTLPDGTRFGDAVLVDPAYAYKTMDDIFELLGPPNDAGFIEDGSTPTPDPDFIK